MATHLTSAGKVLTTKLHMLPVVSLMFSDFKYPAVVQIMSFELADDIL